MRLDLLEGLHKNVDEPQQDFNHVQIGHPEAGEAAVSTSEELAIHFKQFYDVCTRAVL